MDNLKLIKIGDIAEKFKISSRTLRYYEEIGLITSIRDEESNYRYYDYSAEIRLKEILVLRKVDIGIKEICEILELNDVQKTEDIFVKKIETIEENIENLVEVKNALHGILTHFRNNIKTQIDKQVKVGKEIIKAEEGNEHNKKREENKTMDKKSLIDNQVRIVKIKPCRVAYYIAEGVSPENDAWDVMRKWVKENGLEERNETRYFGFNNPSPQKGKPEYGYEVWVTVAGDVKESGAIRIKEFKGGTYAVATANGIPEIGEMWGKLHNWVEEKEYKRGEWQWLEENIVIDDNSWTENMQIELLYPIELK